MGYIVISSVSCILYSIPNIEIIILFHALGVKIANICVFTMIRARLPTPVITVIYKWVQYSVPVNMPLVASIGYVLVPC